jgi:hypothetical protein
MAAAACGSDALMSELKCDARRRDGHRRSLRSRLHDYQLRIEQPSRHI